MSIQITEIERSIFARRSKIQIDAKTITAPFYGVIIRNRSELNVVSRISMNCENLQTVLMNVYDAGDIVRNSDNTLNQKTLGGAPMDIGYHTLRTSKLWIADPCTHWYYYKNDEVKNKLINFNSFSKTTRDIIESFNNKNHAKIWKAMYENTPAFIKFIKDNLDAQIEIKADVLYPPAPLINAGDPEYMLDVWYETNKVAGIYAKTKGKQCAISLTLNVNNFIGESKIDLLFQKLELIKVKEEMGDIKIILLKIMREDELERSVATARNNYGRFTKVLSQYATETNRAVILLNSNSLGHISISLGDDGFVGPLNGVTGANFGISKSHRGMYYHYEAMKFYPYEEIKKIYESKGRILPCFCSECKNINGKDLNTLSNDDWNNFRRAHLILVRNEELKECHEAITNQNMLQGMKNKIGRSDIKQFVDVLQ